MSLYKDNFDQIRSWFWNECPNSICRSAALPKIVYASGGGYEETLVLQCPDCHLSLEMKTVWEPELDRKIINEAAELTAKKIFCPYLSIGMPKDNTIVFRCRADSTRECFGRDFNKCYSYNHQKCKEFYIEGDLEKAELVANKSMKLFRKDWPASDYLMGIYTLLKIRMKKDAIGWQGWIDGIIDSYDNKGYPEIAARICLVLAHDYEMSEYWQKSAHFDEKTIKKLSVAPLNESFFQKRKRINRKIEYEALFFEASAMASSNRVSQLKQAQAKWHELYSRTRRPFHYCRALENAIKINPNKATSIYKEIGAFLEDISGKTKNEYHKKYFEGFSKYYQALSIFHEASTTPNIAKRHSEIKKAINLLEEAKNIEIEIGHRNERILGMICALNAYLRIEQFEQTKNPVFLQEAFEHIETEAASHYPIVTGLIHELLKIVDHLINVRPSDQDKISVISFAKTKLKDYSRLLETHSLDIGYEKFLDYQRSYLDTYIKMIENEIITVSRRSATLSNILQVLLKFKELVERQVFEAFRLTPKPLEEIGRCLVQTALNSAFSTQIFTFKEVPTGKGRMDILLICKGSKIPFEIKIWNSSVYFEKGLSQLSSYMQSENVKHGFYLVFDNRKEADRSVFHQKTKAGIVTVMFIAINPQSPTSSA